MLTIIKVLFSMLFMLSMLQNSYADRRSYVWTYEYATMPKGELELEYYNTLEWTDKSNSKTNTWKHWFELEYGISDNWDVSMYQQFKQSNSSTSANTKFEYDGLKVRTRYRLGQRGDFFVDPVMYLELKRDDDFTKPNILEAKAILAKDFDNINIAFNYILDDVELVSGAKPVSHKYSTGISYEFNPAFKLGLESTGNFSAQKYYLGPTVSFASSKIWADFGVIYGLNSKSDYTQVRTLIGIFL